MVHKDLQIIEATISDLQIEGNCLMNLYNVKVYDTIMCF